MEGKKKYIQLFKNKTECCGCGICAILCSQNAIEMVEDEEGFLYPNVKESKCIKCGVCERNCALKNKRMEIRKGE